MTSTDLPDSQQLQNCSDVGVHAQILATGQEFVYYPTQVNSTQPDQLNLVVKMNRNPHDSHTSLENFSILI